MSRALAASCAPLLLALTPVATAQFELLASNPTNLGGLNSIVRAVSGNGDFAVGRVHVTSSVGFEDTLWDSNGTPQVVPHWPPSFTNLATGISGDGSFMVGNTSSLEFVTWTINGGVISSPTFQGNARPRDVSEDGSVVVGLGFASRWFRWTNATGIALLPTLDPNGLGISGAHGVSPDGLTVVGESRLPASSRVEPVYWSAAQGLVSLGTPAGHEYGAAMATSQSGDVIIGFTSTLGNMNAQARPFRWTAATGRQPLPLPIGAIAARALDLSADGAVAVGQAVFPGGILRAVVWDSPASVRLLADLLAQRGVPVPSGWELTLCTAISLDGTTIVGSSEMAGISRAFRAGLPLASSMGLGVSFCGSAFANSTGLPARIQAMGSATAADNDVTLSVTGLPTDVFGYFITSLVQQFNPPMTGPLLCIGGATIGRYNGPGQVLNSGAAGSVSLAIDLTATPTAGLFIPTVAGETRHWQYWYRDANPSPTTNMSDGVSISFQ